MEKFKKLVAKIKLYHELHMEDFIPTQYNEASFVFITIK